MKCFNCQKLGHRAAECTAAKRERNGGAEAGSPSKAAGRKCFKCGQVGHMKVNCPGKTAVDKTAKVEGNGGGAASEAVRFQVSKAVRDGQAPAGTERISAILNKRVQVYFSVDTITSKSVVTEGTLGELQLEMPVATQRLREAVRFQLADNSEVVCSTIAYLDFAIATAKHLRPIELRAVPLFVLPGPKGDILLGKAQQEELGLTSTSRGGPEAR